MQCFTYVHSYVSMEKHLDSCESRLQERISEVETLKNRSVSLQTASINLYILCMYVALYIHVCVLITNWVDSMGRCFFLILM